MTILDIKPAPALYTGVITQRAQVANNRMPKIFLYVPQRLATKRSFQSAVVVTAIRVQDVTRNIWYSWDNGTWDNAGGTGNNAPVGQTPQCKAGGGLYVAFYAINDSNVTNDTDCHLQLWQNNMQQKTVTQTVPQGQSFGYEWDGIMLNDNATISLVSWSDHSPTQTLTFPVAVIGVGGGGGIEAWLSKNWPYLAAGAAAAVGIGVVIAVSRSKQK
jgi:hypothetical protein